MIVRVQGLPIYKSLLMELLKLLDIHFSKLNQPYLLCLYQTILITMSYGLFRISEVATTESMHVIKVSDVKIGDNKNKVLFILCSSKTLDKHTRPQFIKISAREVNSMARSTRDNVYCPFNLLEKFMKLRPKYKSSQEPFFVFKDYYPVTAQHVNSVLKIILHAGGFNENLYSCHSLRGEGHKIY